MQTIESYLVSLGFAVDNAALRRWEDALNRLSETVAKHTTNPLTGIGGMFVKTGGMIIGTLAALEGAVAGVAFHTANMDLNMQIAARRMFMDVGKFRDMKTALDALGVSMEDVMFGPPELRQRYAALMGDESRMGLDANWEKQMRRIRDVEFQFTRMRMIFERGFIPQFVGSLSKQLFGDQGDLERNLDMFNEKFIRNLPKWSDELSTKIVPVMKETIELINKIPAALQTLLPILKDIGERAGIVWDVIKLGVGGIIDVGKSVIPNTPMDNLREMQANARALAAHNNIDPALFEAIVSHETGGTWNPKSRNPTSGAYGLSQLMPDNMHAYGFNGEDPFQNLEIGARLFGKFLKEFNGDVPRALQAYGGFVSKEKIQNEFPGYYSDIMRRAEEYKSDPFKPTSGHDSVSPTFHTQVTVNVDGSKDPHAIGQAVGNEIDEKMNKLFNRLLIEMGGVYA
jgi:hypothetical protein